MFSFFKKKALKVIAVNTYQALIEDQITGAHLTGRTASEISTVTGLNFISTVGMLKRLQKYDLIEELQLYDTPTFKAKNIPSDLYLDGGRRGATFEYSKKSVDKVDFSGIS
ncbi:hypothetical protein ATY37_14835 [Vibrio cidicii]|uniref:Transcriptional regulator n=1 Tax=Vibrio cidicii TaxID=1763883 RepID=A0A151KYJ9_9VIBR|nr:hypothetical protein [Vibrio cidicii]KYN88880.1 hypothetical protein ATY37_14835 [Vibrio cidicii]